MEVAVPVVPDTTPAPSSVQRLRGRSSPRLPAAITASTARPTRMPRACTGTAVSSQMPTAVLAARPTRAQDTPGQSVCLASRARMSTGRKAPASSIDPGMSAGTSSVTTGAATRPSPRPTPLCTSAPSTTAIPLMRRTVVGGISQADVPTPAGTGTVAVLTPAPQAANPDGPPPLSGSLRQRDRPSGGPAHDELAGQHGEQDHDRDGPAAGRGVQEPDHQRAWRGHEIARSLGER